MVRSMHFVTLVLIYLYGNMNVFVLEEEKKMNIIHLLLETLFSVFQMYAFMHGFTYI